MAVDHIRYDILTQDALRGVMRTVLADAAANGLPGEHHFYISFDTQAEGVRLSPRMREQYPEEMTVVLQHQFWDLTVTDDAFEVGLAFGGVAERLAVPFVAIKRFWDPSVQFALQFETIEESSDVQESSHGGNQESRPADRRGAKRQAPSKESGKAAGAARPPAEHKPARTQPALTAVPTPANAAPGSTAPGDGPDKPPPAGGEVVRLDRFRKK